MLERVKKYINNYFYLKMKKFFMYFYMLNLNLVIKVIYYILYYINITLEDK